MYVGNVQVDRSSYEHKSITFTGSFYKKGRYSYYYTARSVDADDYLKYRNRMNLKNDMRETSNKALAKEQKDKAGGILAINIPIKSKAMESLFGEGGAGLKVSGYHQITVSGRSQWDDRTTTATYRQNKFPTLNMEQISRFDINGTIGSKITVSVSQDSKTDIPLANRIMIRYKGDEDDIIQTIEAGNTTLSLPNTQFVGYSSRIKGLFGVKTTAKIGGLELTAIASQEKGTTERTTVTAGSSSRKQQIRDYAYLDGKIFDLGRLNKEKFDIIDFNPAGGDVIQEIAVYKRVTSTMNNALGTEANMYVDPDDTTAYSGTENISNILVEEVPAEEYYVDNNDFWIMFDKANAGSYDAEIGVWLVVQRGGSGGAIDTIGSIEAPPYHLKLIKARNPIESYQTFQYAWRNVYSIGSLSGGVELDGLDIKIYKGLANTEGSDDNLDHDEAGVPYITLLRLDRYDQNGNLTPDYVADVYSDIVIASAGLLIFPDREPFNIALTDSTSGLGETVPEIYNTKRASTDALKASKYYIEVTSLTKSNEISLGKTNIIEGSERITSGGILLQRGDDYTINYDFGKVTLGDNVNLNDELSIDFEYSPYIQAQKKTLFGVRGEYELNPNLKFGSTILYKSDKATQRKPKIGQETSKMFVWDGDVSFKVQPNFLSTFADALPFFNTEQESNLGVTAEIAQSYPNPNVDGVAYLDDFEGSRDSYSLSVYRESWSYSSKPYTLDDFHLRGWMNWFNPYDQVPTKSIWNKDVTATSSMTQVLQLNFEPATIDRRVGNTPDTLTGIDSTMSWAGIMRGLIGSATDMSQADMVELRMKGQKGILHIDIGEISEDINGNGKTDDEDVVINNGILDDTEDIGLDGLADVEETGYDKNTNPDPDGDNFYYDGANNPYYVRYINGTENNKSDGGTLGLPDIEDFNRDQSAQTRNNYFSYRIDLSDEFDRFFVPYSRNDYGWGTYRIPLRDSSLIDAIIGSPVWENVEFVRIWIESPDGQKIEGLQIASAEIISPNWEDTIIMPSYAVNADTSTQQRFSVAVIGTQDNDPENPYYTSPPGVTGYHDVTADIVEPEQSLLLTYENFRVYDSVTADTGLVERVLFDTPNLMGYGVLKMFIRAPEDLADGSSLTFLFRLGQNNQNYYEMRNTIRSDQWIDTKGWIDLSMNFDDITGLKEFLERARLDNADTNYIDSSINGVRYRVFGKPNITKIKYLAFGVVPLKPDSLISGDLWIDELRLTDVRNDVGTAARITASGNVADLFTYNAGYSYENAYFRKISSSTRGGSTDNLGSGKSTSAYNYGVNFKLDKFLPRSLGANIPVNYRYSRNTSVPRLKYNSDIILPEELRYDERTESITKSITASESFNKKTKNPLFTILLNNMRTNASYTRLDGISPSAPMSMSESYGFRSSYGYNFGKVPGIRVFFWTQPMPVVRRLSGSKIFLMPSNMSMTADINRSLRISRSSVGVLQTTMTKTFAGSFKTTYKIMESLSASYSMDTRRDISNPDLVNITFNPDKFKLGRETKYSQAFSASYTPSLFSFLTHKFNFSTSYIEDFIVNNNTRNMAANKSYGAAGSFDLQKLLGAQSSSRRSTPRKR
ncbi:MAG: cell surface protein SprA, partial [Candidatus Zixiibacteriota bacterium]